MAMFDITPKLYIESARQSQRMLRWASCGSLGYAVVTVLLFSVGVMSIVPLVASLCAAGVVYFQHYHSFGHIQHWWWMRRGTILACRDNDKHAEATQWCNDMFDGQFTAVTPYCFKFYKRSDAVAFTLVWG